MRQLGIRHPGICLGKIDWKRWKTAERVTGAGVPSGNAAAEGEGTGGKEPAENPPSEADAQPASASNVPEEAGSQNENPDEAEETGSKPEQAFFPEGRNRFSFSSHAVPLTPGLSEEELTELLAPVKEPAMTMPGLSEEELNELLAPSPNSFADGEGLELDEDEELESMEEEDSVYAMSLMAEVSGEDDPELKELARQIVEIQRQEHAEKSKKKNKKKQKKSKNANINS